MAEIAHRFRSARDDPALAVLEGFHALKHALRFGGEITAAVTPDIAAVMGLAETLAPDVAPALAAILTEVGRDLFRALTPAPPPTPLVALARRPAVDVAAILATPGTAPVVLLDRPNHLGNVGAVVRVAAGAGAAGVITTGERDPWHPAALRGSAGLHFAVPVARTASLPPTDRPLVAVDPGGASLWEADLPPRALIAFGGERRGLDPALRASARMRVGIPMRSGVSSLNLATAAAVVLFSRRLAANPAPPAGGRSSG